jgi:hypothetical protein
MARKTRQEWSDTVQRMIERGTSLSEQESRQVIDSLSSAYGIE